ncbi:hypothetical protein Taro_040834 [Colocasia esculenta]|uniref:C2 domain-containing protein n=1 Tax=Colocasia esculenta TaxID=4460 RepID=A0A843WRK3_COLES|nr:hypothetical protein [Colocasia esculenta]
MASRYEVEVTVVSAKNLKNVNWRHGDLHPYAVVWVDPAAKCSTKVAIDGDGEDPVWDEKLVVPLGHDRSLDDAVLSIDIVHANAEKDTKPLVGSARLPLREIVDEVGIGGKATRSLKVKRPSGRPQGKLEIRVAVKEPPRYYEPPPPGTRSYAPPYGQQSRDYWGGAPYAYGASPYGAPPPTGYPYGAPPPSGYPYSEPPVGYGAAPAYGQSSSYAQQPYAAVGEKKSKMGMGTGLAVGAAAGLLGGLALAEGVDYVEDKIADDVADRVENDLGYDDDF